MFNIKAWRLGFEDGLRDGRKFSMGLTWADNDEANEAYDRGVTAGQRLASLVGR